MRSSGMLRPMIAYMFFIVAITLERSHAIHVQSGDSFAKLAAEQVVSVAALEAANPGVAPNNLQPNQILSVPVPSTPGKPTTSPPPAPPPTAAKPAPTTTSVTPVMTVGQPSCAPSPIGRYSDADEVYGKTEDFCNKNGHRHLSQVLAAPFYGLLSGDSQEDNGDHGNGGLASNENGYNMTMSAIPGCSYPQDGVEYTLGQPLGPKASQDWVCTAILLNCYQECEYSVSL